MNAVPARTPDDTSHKGDRAGPEDQSDAGDSVRCWPPELGLRANRGTRLFHQARSFTRKSSSTTVGPYRALLT